MSEFNIFRHLLERESGKNRQTTLIDLENEQEDVDEDDLVLVDTITLPAKPRSPSPEVEILSKETVMKATVVKETVAKKSPENFSAIQVSHMKKEIITISDDDESPSCSFFLDRTMDESLRDHALLVTPRKPKRVIRDKEGKKRTVRSDEFLTNEDPTGAMVIDVEDPDFMEAADKYAVETEKKSNKKERRKLKSQGRTIICRIENEQAKLDASPPETFKFTNFKIQLSEPLAVSFPPTRQYEPSQVDHLTLNTYQDFGMMARMFEYVQDPPEIGTDCERLRICSYNVLCQTTAVMTKHLYRHLRGPASYALEWESRSSRLKDEFKLLDADIFGLQEVESTFMDEFYYPVFTNLGYTIHYKKKTGTVVDGCLFAYRKDRFILRHYHEVEYFLGDLMDRHQIGQITILYDKMTGQHLCFANTHLLYNEKRGDIKLGQLAVLFASIDRLLTTFGSKLPVFVTGDFNLQPYSPLYDFITKGRLCVENTQRHVLSGQVKARCFSPIVDQTILPTHCGITRGSVYGKNTDLQNDLWTHRFVFASAYCHIAPDNDDEISTFHAGDGNPDFIFYTVEKTTVTDTAVKIEETDLVHLITRLTLPSKKMMENTLGPWPNPCVPSDHIPLLAEFAIKKITREMWHK